jgi:hypothetical protein
LIAVAVGGLLVSVAEVQLGMMPLRLDHFGTLLELSRFATKFRLVLPSPVGGWFLRLRLSLTIANRSQQDRFQSEVVKHLSQRYLDR